MDILDRILVYLLREFHKEARYADAHRLPWKDGLNSAASVVECLLEEEAL